MDKATVREQYFAAWTKLSGTQNPQIREPDQTNLTVLNKPTPRKPQRTVPISRVAPVTDIRTDSRQIDVEPIVKSKKRLKEFNLAQDARIPTKSKVPLSMDELMLKYEIDAGPKEGPILLKHAFYRYMHDYAQQQCRSARRSVHDIKQYWAPIANLPLDEVTVGIVRQWHLGLANKIGIHTANRQLALLGSVYQTMYNWELYTGRNPARGIKKFKEQSRTRFLNQVEVNRILEVLPQINSKTFQDYVRLSLHTGQRQGNILSMQWKDIDLINRTWTIPRTKNGDSHIVPLIDPAMEVLLRRYTSKRNQYVLSSRLKKYPHYTWPIKAWSRLKELSGLHDIRPHDLRRTMASWQAINGTEVPVIAATLGHKSWASTQVYARLNLQPVRNSMSQAAKAMRGE